MDGYSDISGGFITFRGGQGIGSDDLKIRTELLATPADFRFQIRFRVNTPHSNARSDLVMDFGGNRYFAGNGPTNLNGRSGLSFSEAIATGTWYMLEIIDSTGPSAAGFQFVS